jgi:hypothetical protein
VRGFVDAPQKPRSEREAALRTGSLACAAVLVAFRLAHAARNPIRGHAVARWAAPSTALCAVQLCAPSSSLSFTVLAAREAPSVVDCLLRRTTRCENDRLPWHAAAAAARADGRAEQAGGGDEFRSARVIADRCLLLLCVGDAPEWSTPCLLPGGRVFGAAVDDFLMCVLLWELGCKSMVHVESTELLQAREGSLACSA